MLGGTFLVVFFLSCYDGDTCKVDIPGWHPVVGESIPVRIAGIDAPEIRGQCEREKQHARLVQRIVESQLRKAKQVQLKNVRRGKYFRLVGDLYADGNNIAEGLLKRGLVNPYDGQSARKSWCPKPDPYKNLPSPAAPESYRPHGVSSVGQK